MRRAVDVLYRSLFNMVLSRLPERAAIEVGQWGLRLVPIDLLPIWRRTDPRLGIRLGGVALANPLILSSMYYDPRILRRVMGLGFGAVTAKSITRAPRPGHPHPNLVRVRTPEGPGLVNCNGFMNPGLDAYRRAIASLPHRVPLIVSAAGESVEEYVEVVRGLEAHGDLVELNISSPNTKLVYEWSTRPATLHGLFQAVRRATSKPLIAKVSPDFRDVNEEIIVPAALDAGISIVTAGNTRRIDEPRLSQRTGGLSGPAIFPATLDNVRRLRDRFPPPLQIIACGGIDAPDKARAALAAGADACALFTGFITRGPILPRLILDALAADRR